MIRFQANLLVTVKVWAWQAETSGGQILKYVRLQSHTYIARQRGALNGPTEPQRFQEIMLCVRMDRWIAPPLDELSESPGYAAHRLGGNKGSIASGHPALAKFTRDAR